MKNKRAASAFPEHLWILGHYVRIQKAPRVLSYDAMGDCDYKQCEIRILDDLAASVTYSTLLHETIHFIDKGLDLKLKEEQVALLAEALYYALVTNRNMLPPRDKK